MSHARTLVLFGITTTSDFNNYQMHPLPGTLERRDELTPSFLMLLGVNGAMTHLNGNISRSYRDWPTSRYLGCEHSKRYPSGCYFLEIPHRRKTHSLSINVAFDKEDKLVIETFYLERIDRSSAIDVRTDRRKFIELYLKAEDMFAIDCVRLTLTNWLKTKFFSRRSRQLIRNLLKKLP